MKCIILAFLLLNVCHIGFSQQIKNNFESKDSLYNANINKSKLYGVYIPRDIDDAMMKLLDLTTEEARKPLIRINEDTIAKKLHFGMGRWIEYNWNFAEGSRLSHLLRQKGIIYVDDMTYFMLVSFHRFISKKPLESEVLISKIIDNRNKKIKLEQEKMPIIHSETKKVIKK